jgi:hypothetical protein
MQCSHLAQKVREYTKKDKGSTHLGIAQLVDLHVECLLLSLALPSLRRFFLLLPSHLHCSWTDLRSPRGTRCLTSDRRFHIFIIFIAPIILKRLVIVKKKRRLLWIHTQ